MGRSRRWVAGAGGLVVVGLVATGCTKEDPLPPLATTVVTATTTQASPEDLAFAEAEAVFRRYNDLQDQLYQEPADPDLQDQLEQYATGIELDSTRQLFESYSKEGWHTTGTSKIQWVKRSGARLNAKPPRVTIRACIDSSGVTLLDKNGSPVAVSNQLHSSDNKVILDLGPNGTWRVVRISNELVSQC